MERRFEVRKEELLAACEVPPEMFHGMLSRLRKFVKPFLGSLFRSEGREHANTYVAGLLSNLKRKNAEAIAYRRDQERMGLQTFVGQSPWDHRPLVQELVRQVGRELGQADAVIVFDPSGYPKKGAKSVGVARQWLGRLGKVDNGQVGVYMGYASRVEHTLVDTRLYLPQEWTRDKQRCKAAGVPQDEMRFRTRHQLALEMLDEHAEVLPHAWVAGDSEMGRSTCFRRDLADRQQQYLLAVPSNTTIRYLEESGDVKHDYYLSNASAKTSLKEFARVSKEAHRIEESIKRGKSEAGLADYQVRNWLGWHHHQVLSLIAVWFLVLEALRGEKMDTGYHRPSAPRSTVNHDPSRVEVSHAATTYQRARAKTPTQRTRPVLSLQSSKKASAT